MDVRREPKFLRLKKEAKQQEQVEYLWQSLKYTIDRDIHRELFTLYTYDARKNYQLGLETLFIQYARERKVPRYKIYQSNAFSCLKQISRKADLDPRKFRKTITQLEECCRKRIKNPRFI